VPLRGEGGDQRPAPFGSRVTMKSPAAHRAARASGHPRNPLRPSQYFVNDLAIDASDPNESGSSTTWTSTRSVILDTPRQDACGMFRNRPSSGRPAPTAGLWRWCRPARLLLARQRSRGSALTERISTAMAFSNALEHRSGAKIRRHRHQLRRHRFHSLFGGTTRVSLLFQARLPVLDRARTDWPAPGF
jgi:hypothetical protein